MARTNREPRSAPVDTFQQSFSSPKRNQNVLQWTRVVVRFVGLSIRQIGRGELAATFQVIARLATATAVRGQASDRRVPGPTTLLAASRSKFREDDPEVHLQALAAGASRRRARRSGRSSTGNEISNLRSNQVVTSLIDSTRQFCHLRGPARSPLPKRRRWVQLTHAFALGLSRYRECPVCGGTLPVFRRRQYDYQPTRLAGQDRRPHL